MSHSSQVTFRNTPGTERHYQEGQLCRKTPVTVCVRFQFPFCLRPTQCNNMAALRGKYQQVQLAICTWFSPTETSPALWTEPWTDLHRHTGTHRY